MVVPAGWLRIVIIKRDEFDEDGNRQPRDREPFYWTLVRKGERTPLYESRDFRERAACRQDPMAFRRAASRAEIRGPVPEADLYDW
jgi:hypothetical protein